jgi:hypothetical protein
MWQQYGAFDSSEENEAERKRNEIINAVSFFSPVFPRDLNELLNNWKILNWKYQRFG